MFTYRECPLSMVTTDPFSKSSFFDDFHHDIKESTRKVVDSFRRKDASWDDEFDSYRRLRSFDEHKDGVTLTRMEEGDTEKISIDVSGYPVESLKVRCTGDGCVLVEGFLEKKEGESIVKKSFKRQFNLPPSAKPEDVQSTLSANGVLTIKLPKQVQAIKFNEKGKEEGKTSSEHTKSVIIRDLEDEILPRIPQDCHLSEDSKVSQEHYRLLQERHLPEEQKRSTTTSYSTERKEERPSFKIARQDSFFDDPIFQDTQEDFQLSVRDIVNRSRSKLPDLEDSGTAYRNLREQSQSLQNRACTQSEDSTGYKIVMDATGFNDLNVKCEGNDYLLVEGKYEGGAKDLTSSHSFSRRFHLPGMVVERVTSALSREGILTISAPKRVPRDY